MSGIWRRCSACKSDIPLGGLHYVCSVSTCNRKRTGLVFCSVDCWEIHLPTERHREAWAVEARAPATPEPAMSASTKSTPAPTTKRDRVPSRPTRRTTSSAPRAIVRRRRTDAPTGPAPSPTTASDEGEILVVASKLKQYVRDTSGFNTSDRVLPVLSAALRRICDEAIENARRAERLTVLDRDVPRG